MSKSAKINVFVGCGSDRDLVFGVPKQLLAEFAPNLRSGLSSIGALSKAVVVLPEQDKPSVGWFLRFALAGGVDKDPQNVDRMSIAVVVSRLCLLSYVGLVTGKLFDGLRNRLGISITNGSVTMQDLARIYDENASKSIRNVAEGLTRFVVGEVLEGRMTQSVLGATACKPFYTTASTSVKNKQSHIRWLQRGKMAPLTVFQLIFIYQFSETGDDIRKSVTRDLIKLFDDGNVKHPRAYMRYGDVNGDFEEDMQAAILQGAKQQQFLERKARREGKKVETQTRALPTATTSPIIKSGMKKDKNAATKGAKLKKVTFSETVEPAAEAKKGKNKAGPAKKKARKNRVAPRPNVERGIVLVLTNAGELKRER